MNKTEKEIADLKSDVKSRCLNVLEEKKYKNFDDTEIIVQDSLNAMGAFIAFNDRKIRVVTGEELYEAIDYMNKTEKLNMDRNLILNTTLNFVMPHEYSHHSICPSTKEKFEEILQGCFDAIQGKEYREEKIMQHCANIQNMFTDTVINTINSHTEDKEKYRGGLDLFYLLMSTNQKREMKKHGFLGKVLSSLNKMDKANTLFLSSNQLLCQSSPEIEKKLKKYYPYFFASFPRYRKKLIDIFTGDEKLTYSVLDRKLSQEAEQDLVSRLEDYSLWKQMAYDYSNIIHQFLKEEKSWLKNSYTRNEDEKKEGEHSPGRGQSPKKQEGKQDGQGKDNEKPEGNKDKNISKSNNKDGEGMGNGDKKDEENKDKIGAGKEDEKNSSKKGGSAYRLPDGMYEVFKKFMEIGPKPEESPFLPMVDRLDALYKQRAGKLALFGEENSPARQFEKNIGLEKMSFNEFSSKDIEWSATRMKRNAGKLEMELYKRTFPLVLPFEAEESPLGIPDISYIFDSSISMKFDPFKEEGEGEYHLACLTFYSILNYLEHTGIAPLLNFNLINFSYSTVASGWKPYSQLYDVKKALFEYQGGGTVLNPIDIKKLNEQRKDNFISFMLSDTEFNFKENEKEILKEVENLVSTGGAGFFLFQIGRPTTFSREVEKIGSPVHYIQGVEDFKDISIKFTKELYGRVIKNGKSL